MLTGGHDPSHLEDATLVVTGPGRARRGRRCSTGPGRAACPSGARWSSAPGSPTCPTWRSPARTARRPRPAMIEACLRADGIDAVACGNIGHPFPEAAREGHEALVVECSSFQLRMQESFHPRVSVLLNLAPDHLDEHGTFEAYADAKARIFAAAGAGRHARRQPRRRRRRRALAPTAPCDVVWFRSGAPGDGEVGYDDDGARARASAAAARAARRGRRQRRACGRTPPPPQPPRSRSARRRGPCATGSRASQLAPHRGQVAAVVDGVRFVDDSKATNVHAALAAIDGVDDAVLIAGGRAKGVDLSPLATRAARLRAVVAIGEAAPEHRPRLRGSHARCTHGRVDRGRRARRVRRSRGRAGASCSRRRVRAGISSATTPSAGTGSRRRREGSSRRWAPVAAERTRRRRTGPARGARRRRAAPRPCTRLASTCCCCSCRRPCSRCSGS